MEGDGETENQRARLCAEVRDGPGQHRERAWPATGPHWSRDGSLWKRRLAEWML